MFSIGPLAFAAPWLLLALLALPVLWWLLRALPPRPALRRFPGVSLLFGLKEKETTPDHTPWWLILLRVTALAAAILGFAHPLLHPRTGSEGSGPLLILSDGDWSLAPDWAAVQARIGEILSDAALQGRPAAYHALTDTPPGESTLGFARPDRVLAGIAGAAPRPWHPDRAGFAAWLENQDLTRFETIWFSTGLSTGFDHGLANLLLRQGPVTVIAPEAPPHALLPPVLDGGLLAAGVIRSTAGAAETRIVSAHGTDPAGVERLLGQAEVTIPAGEIRAEARLDLPPELRNRLGRLTLSGGASAGTTILLDDGTRRRKVGLLAGEVAQEGQNVTAPLFFLERALAGSADVIHGSLAEILGTGPDVLILADVGTLTEAEETAVTAWIEDGGMFLRFAGPRLAQSGAGQVDEDPLLPVRLRAGGRDLSGALSWSKAKALAAFPSGSPFEGLAVPPDVLVTAQVVAQPGPELQARVLALLQDGTPIVTGKPLGAGQVVLFHVTANADWSNLPLSGLFVEMLQRLSVAANTGRASAEALAGRDWTPVKLLDGFGQVTDPGPRAPVPGADLVAYRAGPDHPPGLYAAGEALVAVNLFGPDAELQPLDALPAALRRGTLTSVPETDLKPPLLLLAMLALGLDLIAALALGGKLPLAGRAAVLLLALALPAGQTRADDATAIEATTETVLAYVLTGNPELDALSEAGLAGLSRILAERTSVEPAPPHGVDPEGDELAFYPFLYWPVGEGQADPSDQAVERLNAYLRTGGMILFDTRDANLATGIGLTPNGRALQRLASRLDIPPLEPLPPDHVVSRTFYLLEDFPGRWTGGAIWVEAAPDSETVEGQPFRNLNDGVTPVVIGGNDWASAWALSPEGLPVYPVGRGIGGERQREYAWRFGVNLIMHVMTGNYKSDQVHVPALLERLGQ